MTWLILTPPPKLFIISICVIASLLSVVYARTSTNGTQWTSTVVDPQILSTEEDAFVSWPGVTWLHNFNSDPTHTFTTSTSNGQTYLSAYDAILGPNAASHMVKTFNCFINYLFLPHSLSIKVVQYFGNYWSHYVLSYIRNLIAAMFVYYGTAGFFHYHCYIHPRSKAIFQNRTLPSKEIILDQIKLAQSSIFIYVGLPVVSEFVIEEGYTKVYYSISEIGGWIPYVLYTILYFSLVEIGIYWMHRTLHTNKTLYKYIHMPHHKYSKPETLTPWASIAFHPLDGILQACPYVLVLPIVPCHYLTHLIMVFFTAVWATYIHDAMDWNIDPIMGSKYHTIHHTHYIYNYGQIFTFCDAIWGTLRVPVGKTGVMEGPDKVQLMPAQPGWFGSTGRGTTMKQDKSQ